MAETDIAAIAAGLTATMRAALIHENAGGHSYRWARMGTLAALHSRDLVRRVGGLGAFYSPQTAIDWPLTPLGLAVREYLKSSETGSA